MSKLYGICMIFYECSAIYLKTLLIAEIYSNYTSILELSCQQSAMFSSHVTFSSNENALRCFLKIKPGDVRGAIYNPVNVFTRIIQKITLSQLHDSVNIDYLPYVSIGRITKQIKNGKKTNGKYWSSYVQWRNLLLLTGENPLK